MSKKSGLSESKTAYPIADWKNLAHYPINPTKYADPAYLKLFLSDSADQKALARHIWRWEFLRRHPLYQQHWDLFDDDPKQFGQLFDLAIYAAMPPAQKLDRPMVFNASALNNQSSTATKKRRNSILVIMPTRSLEDHMAALKIAYKRACEKAKITVATRLPSDAHSAKFLRVLDAKAAGANYSEIGSVLGKIEGSNERSKLGQKLFKQAQAAQAKITGLPITPLKK